MDLFEAAARDERAARAPLAVRMRPRTLAEFAGQRALVGEGSLLRRVFEGKSESSLILFGPPGTGKTTLAHLIARGARAHFTALNAVTSGVADVRTAIKEAAERAALHGRRTIVFIDEIHRFNRAQQDALLPAVEDGTITLIGATTENPFFAVNGPLLSRARVVRLEPLTNEEIRTIVRRAMQDEERGLGGRGLSLDPDAEAFICEVAAGDARTALNILELAAEGALEREHRVIDVDLAQKAAQRPYVRYDKDGDSHYDVASAFIKSLRGSDPDAALYWMARMLEAGEDPNFIARRIIIQASEDVGNADPMALVVASAAAAALDRVGMPEAQLALAQAALYVATAPKSNAACTAILEARAEIREHGARPVPLHLRDAHYAGAERLGHGRGYVYPHDEPDGFAAQSYWPEGMARRRYYRPVDRGHEAVLRRRLDEWWGDDGDERPDDGDDRPAR